VFKELPANQLQVLNRFLFCALTAKFKHFLRKPNKIKCILVPELLLFILEIINENVGKVRVHLSFSML
jgi:hypothetical protein